MPAVFADPNAIPPADHLASAGRTTQARDAKRRKIVQALTAQDVFYSDMTNDELGPKERSMAARAWIELQDCIRVLKGKPLPGVLKPELRERPRRRAMIAADSHAVLEAMVRERLSREQQPAGPKASEPTEPRS